MNIKVFHLFSSWKGFYIPGKKRERDRSGKLREKRGNEMKKMRGQRKRSFCHCLWFISHLFCPLMSGQKTELCGIIYVRSTNNAG